MKQQAELTIDALGSRGDGVAQTERGPIYVAGALPQEVVLAEEPGGERARLIRVVSPSAQRIKPVCAHFGSCGGCAVQHLEPTAYLAWKQSLVEKAFLARGLDVTIGNAFCVSDGMRRRAVMSAESGRTGIQLGFNASASNDLVEVDHCPLLTPMLNEALPGLSALLGPIVSGSGVRLRVALTEADNGIDVSLSGEGVRLFAEAARAIADAAGGLGIIRVSVGKDIAYQAAPPHISFGPGRVELPPTAFLQACLSAEAQMRQVVVDAVSAKVARTQKRKPIADLFCGLGAFTFALAKYANVVAIDSDTDAIEALRMGAQRSQGLKPIDARVRDLLREPLSRRELNEFRAVIFDPPRAGAREQVASLAKSEVPLVVAVSCNPATLARDARVLVDGGYQMGDLTLIDQFRYSPHTEVIVVFRRK